jgi:hypothetical protein
MRGFARLASAEPADARETTEKFGETRRRVGFSQANAAIIRSFFMFRWVHDQIVQIVRRPKCSLVRQVAALRNLDDTVAKKIRCVRASS